jgi:hypothetical protein
VILERLPTETRNHLSPQRLRPGMDITHESGTPRKLGTLVKIRVAGDMGLSEEPTVLVAIGTKLFRHSSAGN